MPRMEELVMVKELYEELEVELISFAAKDVIVTSQTGETDELPLTGGNGNT